MHRPALGGLGHHLVAGLEAAQVVPEAMSRAEVVTDGLLSVLTPPARERLVRLLRRFVTGG